MITRNIVMAKRKKARSKRSLGIAIVGGGAGGHVYPGIAVARELKRQTSSARVIFIGTKDGPEAEIVPYEGFAFESFEFQGRKSRHTRTTLENLTYMPRAVYRAIQLLKKIKPSILFGTGGEVAIPVIYAAYLLRIPILILEPNMEPGLANRLLSHSVDKIAVYFEESLQVLPKKKTILTGGSPIRREFFLIGETPPPDKGKKLNLLVISGSLGARNINYTMIAALDYLKEYRDRLVFTHQSGNADFEYVKAGYERRDFRADVYQYIRDIPKMYAKAHLVISRSGSSTVAELKASGRPAILIPYPYGDKHQESNALELNDSGMARIIAHEQFSGRTLSHEILRILEHPEEFAQVWPNNRQFQGRDATEQLVHACLQLTTGKNSYEMEL